GNAIAVLQSRENLFEKQFFATDVAKWATGLKASRIDRGISLTWDSDPEARGFRVWKRIPNAKVYPEWEPTKEGLLENACLLPSDESGTFAVTAVTSAKKPLEGPVNSGEYFLFRADESP